MEACHPRGETHYWLALLIWNVEVNGASDAVGLVGGNPVAT
jgi:hypothetical protein